VTPSAEPTAEDIERAWSDPKLANVIYHDWEAETYDVKWSISFDQRCIDYARDRFVAVAGTDGWPYGTALEIGCGTGFFLLNLKQAGVLDEAQVSDLSPGMVQAAIRNGRSLGFDVQGRVADAESIPYDDETFDLVVGHAVLHHIPDVELALREVLRVLKPGGRFVFAGEPTTVGDWYARKLGHLTWLAVTKVSRLPRLRDRWSRPAEELAELSRAAVLESVVDLHTFDPRELAATALRAGAVDVRTTSEELTAALFGWPVRTFEAAVNPQRLGWGWAMFAYRSWQRLSAVDRMLGRALPQQLFYNVLVTGVRPD
jgi:ubiquinone/menaquinone biosynthesis C-methylase UbiE